MRLGGAALLAVAVLALLAVGEQARHSRMAERAEPAVPAARPAHFAPSARPIAAELDALDHELERLLARMNGASGEARVDAMADVINALVRERAELRQALETLSREPEPASAAHGGP